MTCQTFTDCLAEESRAGTMRPNEPLRAHAAACPACAGRLARRQALAADMTVLAASVELPSRAFDDMEVRLRAAFDARQAAASGKTHALPQRAWWGGWRLAAAAASLVLAAAITWYPDRPRPAPSAPKPGPPDRSSVGPPAAPIRPSDAAPAGAPRRSRDSAPAALARRPRTTARGPLRATDDPALLLSDFVALPGSTSLPDFESGHIVRIDVPLAELPTYGLELVPHASADALSADLLVGQDGLPRAIRLASFDATQRSRR